LTTGSAKKAMVYRFERELLGGFVDSASPFNSTQVQFLNREGVVQNIPIEQVKLICFVRDWIDGPAWSRNQYTVRPRQQGLWIRIRFRDGELLEATMPNSVAALDPVALTISPPETAGGVQRVLIPRQAIESFEILGVVGSPLKKPVQKSQNQLSMFD
jgi:hypothetical protein